MQKKKGFSIRMKLIGIVIPIGLYMGDDSGVYLDGSGWVPGDD